MRLPLAALRTLCVLWVLLASAQADARCTSSADLEALGDAMVSDLSCRLAQLTSGGGPCTDPGFPACAGDAPSRMAEIVLGTDPGPVPGWTPKELRCQRDIAIGSARFIQKRLVERSSGARRAKAGRTMKRPGKSCNRAHVVDNGFGAELVRVGEPCSTLLGSIGENIEGTRLSRCVRAALEGEIDDIAPAALRPNIILILTDDQRYDTFDVMPAVSALRDESIRFTNAFVTNPLCTPSRTTILSGRYSHATGVMANHLPDLLDDSDTIATWLAAAGYTNALLGKYVNNVEFLGLTPPQGWHEWKSFLDPSGGEFYGFRLNDNGVSRTLGGSRYSTDWLRNEAIRFIKRNADDAFFLMYTPFAPHSPAEPAKRHDGDLVSYPLHRPPSFLDDVTDKPAWVQFYKFIAPPNIADAIDDYRERELETLLSVDEAVDKILRRLEKLGLTDNTVVVFTSDHGILWGEHWLREKFNPYEESIRVPYTVRYPRRYPLPDTRTQMVLNQDLAPTFAEFAGAAAPPDLDGVSLVPLLESSATPWRDEFLIETLGEFITQPSDSVRTETFKYIDTDAANGVTQELYDLVADPYEQTNLADDPAYAATLADMIARLDALRP